MTTRTLVRTQSPWPRWLGAALAFALGSLPPLALAQPARSTATRAIVLRFEGWNATQARESAVEALASEVELVTEEQAVEAANDIGVDVSAPEGMAQVVRHLRIDLVLAGSVEGRGRRAETVLVALDPEGSELARRAGPSPQQRSDRDLIGALSVEVVREGAAELRRRRAPPPPPMDEPVERPPSRTSGAPSSYRPHVLTVLGGLRLRTVDTSVERGGAPLSFFEADPYPELDVELVYHPWFDAASELRGLFLGVQGGASVGIEYTTASGNQRGMTSLRFRFDVGFRHGVGDLLELGGMLGVGLEGVQLDAPEGFPSTLFTFLRPGAVARLRLAGELCMLELGVGGRIGLDAGPLASAFGPGAFFGGVDVLAGLTGVVAPGFSWAARFGYVYQGLSFSGGGGDLGAATGGLDETLEGQFLVGWSL